MDMASHLNNSIKVLKLFQISVEKIVRSDAVLGPISVSWHLAVASVFILHEGDDADGKNCHNNKLKIKMFSDGHHHLDCADDSGCLSVDEQLCNCKCDIHLLTTKIQLIQCNDICALGNDTIVDWRVNGGLPAPPCIHSLQWTQISFMMLVMRRR